MTHKSLVEMTSIAFGCCPSRATFVVHFPIVEGAFLPRKQQKVEELQAMLKLQSQSEEVAQLGKILQELRPTWSRRS